MYVDVSVNVYLYVRQEDVRSLLGQLDDKQALMDSKLKAARAIAAEAAALSESSDSEGRFRPPFLSSLTTQSNGR